MSTGYRKVYRDHYGPIPVDGDGRKYEIHHIDGNRTNNNPENLKAVSIKEHYDIHYAQGDWAACLRIAAKMRLSPPELSYAAKMSAIKRVCDGSHPFLGSTINDALKASGKHPLVGPENNSRRLNSGVHHFLDREWQKTKTVAQLSNGTHNLLTRSDGTSVSSDRVAAGTHNLLGGATTRKQLEDGKHPSQIKKKCPHCGRTVSSSPYARFHGDKCKRRKEYV